MKTSSAVCLCLAAILAAGHCAEARGKGKEPKLAISKRGKLIFEDDFSGKELTWNTNPAFPWQVAKGSLATRNVGTSLAQSASRSFGAVGDVVVELRLFLPMNTAANIECQKVVLPYARVAAGGGKFGALVLCTHSAATGRVDLAQTAFPYGEPRWVSVTLEIVGSRYAAAVDGRTISHDFPSTEKRAISSLRVVPEKASADILAIDDVKVWEALPKDAPDVEEERTEKVKGEAEESKEEKPPTELSNALGKDAEGNPIVWDISAKGAMRSADDAGKLTKVTLYGPGEMITTIKAQTLMFIGKGEVEIQAGDTTQALKLSGKVTIGGKTPITLRAKKGTVQISDVKAE